MSIFTYFTMWFAFNTLVTIKRIDKLTYVGENKPINELSLGLYFTLCVIGIFGFLFLKKIKRIRYEQYLKNELFYYELNISSLLTPLGKASFVKVKRQLKLIRLERKTRRNKIKHILNPYNKIKNKK